MERKHVDFLLDIKTVVDDNNEVVSNAMSETFRKCIERRWKIATHISSLIAYPGKIAMDGQNI